MNQQDYCKVSKKCSGCQLSNMSYDRQLRYKQNEIRIRFNRLCKLYKIIGADNPTGYRNKAQFVFRKLKDGNIVSGIYQSADRTMVATHSCALHTKEQNEAAKVLAKLFKSFKVEPYDFRRQRGVVKSVFIRQSFSTGELMIVIVCNKGSNFPSSKNFSKVLTEKLPSVSSLILTSHKGNILTAGEDPKVIFGKSHISDKLCGLEFIISYNSFFQINPHQTEILYNKAIEMAGLSPDDTALDAYCGTGTIGLVIANRLKQVYSVEINKNAIRDARQNAAINNIENVNFVCADSEEYISHLREEKIPLTVAFLDPPRAGCSRSFLSALCDLAPERIVYISCNIDTQLRDLRFLMKKGYKPVEVQGVDMFPYTKHVESVMLLTRS